MRATVTRSPVRNDKRRLLASCAVAAGIIALACGGAALAQVAGTGTIVSGGGTPNGGGGTTTTTTVTQTQNVIHWVPTDPAPTGGDINFLPSGSTWEFVGPAGYTVLNRFVNGSGGSLSRQIALNGTVNSYVGSNTGPRGGNIWFYNAGGILIGASGVINVGSLVLTANDIDLTGGLFGPGGTIRFNGASGGTSAITVNGAINANNLGNPGSSYVALVAPRVVQAGAVRVDGSAAYVAAEQVDIRINGGLFDINVTRGAEGGNAITHSGNTTGPAHQDGDTDQNRIYMVAIPKNDAVTMLVSGAIGYDDAVSATEADGAVRLSAGYNIVGGELATTPANATAANITAGDTLFRSSTIARASNVFAAAPTQPLPGSPPPLSSAGQFFVEGSGTFIGDASATVSIGANQSGGATGTFTVQSGGRRGAPGIAAVNVSGGTLSAPGALTVQASGEMEALTGNSRGGTASLTITGGSVTTSGVTVEANGIAGIGTNGEGGDGRGGTASIAVSGAGTLTAGNIFINSIGRGDGTFIDGGGSLTAVDLGGDGQGGTSTLTLSNGGTVDPAALLSLDARGLGATGLVQSGSGTGGTARISLSGAGSSLSATQTFVRAAGDGGGDFASVVTRAGGDAIGGVSEVILDADATATAALGSVLLDSLARGGNASGSENTSGGDATGGSATMTASGGVTAQVNQVTLNTSARAGNAASPSLTSGQNGNARANNVTLAAANGSTIDVSGDVRLFAVGMGNSAENFGTGRGGTIVVSGASGGRIATPGQFIVQAMGGSPATAIGVTAGAGVGGDVDFDAANGTISAATYLVDASGSTASVTGTGGSAQGGSIDLTASNAGRIEATLDSNSEFNAGATSGISANGAAATGGAVRLIANAGTIDMNVGALLNVGAATGGATAAGANTPLGTGGTILVRVAADPTSSSAIDLGDFTATSDGRSEVNAEAAFFFPDPPTGNGRGGTTSIEVQGGSLTASTMVVSADGLGSEANGGTGTGGNASFTQTGGVINVGDLVVSANGLGGPAPGTSGTGIGGTAAINLRGGSITAADMVASAEGYGGQGSTGDDNDPLNIIAGGNGGLGRGGDATINIDGSAIVDASIIRASAAGRGGGGGDFVNATSAGAPGTPGNGGDGIGGTAAINVRGGTTTASGMTADASGIGGNGGNSFMSSSSGGATGIGAGGNGGVGRGGAATIALQTPIPAVASSSSLAQGIGGGGGAHNVGGNGGDGFGGTAQTIVTGFDAGQLAVTLDASGVGGAGANGNDGNGGNGGNAVGGSARARADGIGAAVTVVDTDFLTDGIGGNGGNGQLGFGSSALAAPSGGNGGAGQGGTIEVAAGDGATVTLGLNANSSIAFRSFGTGGNGGAGSNSLFDGAAQAGNGGLGGDGNGGTVRLLATGGTITSNGESVDIAASGQSGVGGVGGAGQGGGANGTEGGIGATRGGRALIEALNGPATPGQIALGQTSIDASGAHAGRIEIRSQGSVGFDSLNAVAFGTAAPTNNDTDVSTTGILLAATGGSIETAASMSLVTEGSIGVYGQGAGTVRAGTGLSMDAGDQIDIRHAQRGTGGATITATDELTINAGTSISGAAGSLIGSGSTLLLAANGANGSVGVDRLDAANIVINTAGAASVEHAEASGNFSANAASFRTGLNSIITGGDISITSPGAVDLGNSTAGGFVQVSGQSIAFNAITAGSSVGLSANGTVAGAEGIRGGSITAGGDVNLFANSIALSGTVTGDASLFALASGGNAAIALADIDGNIGIIAGGDVSGSYSSGGNIALSADGDIVAQAAARGGYVDPNGDAAEGYVFADANGNATLTNSSAATMFGVRAGQAASLNTATAGEDALVVAGTTATLANVTAGDDLTVTAPAGISANGIATTGAGPDNRTLFYGPSSSSGFDAFQIVASAPDQSNIALTAAAGNIGGSNINAFDNLAATAAGTMNATGLLRSGRATNITAGSIMFDAIDAGSTVNIAATGTVAGAEGIRGVQITAGGDIRLDGNSIALSGVVTGGASLLANATGGGAAINRANLAGHVSVSSAGDLGGIYAAGGDIFLTAGADLTASATTTGGFTDGRGTADGNIFIDAIGDVRLTNSRAARMLGVRADGSATIEFSFAGEDVLVVTGRDLAFQNLGAGDDLTVRATGAVNGETLGAASAVSGGPDARTLTYAVAGGFAIAPDDGASGSYGADLSITANSVSALGLSAGDDLSILATGAVNLHNVATSGFGNIGSGSDIRIDARGATRLSSMRSANDIIVAAPSVSFSLVSANRDVQVNTGSASLDTGTNPDGSPRQALSANGNISIAAASTVDGGNMSALGDVTILTNFGISLNSVSGRNIDLTALRLAAPITIGRLASGGVTSLRSGGAMTIGNLTSVGPVSADAASFGIQISDGGNLTFSRLLARNANIRTSGDLFVIDGTITETASLRSNNGQLGVTALTAGDMQLNAGGAMRLTNVTATNRVDAVAGASMTIDGTVTGRTIALASGDIAIASTGRVGTAGTTEALSIVNSNNSSQTFVGGTGTRSGYHIDAAELARVFAADIGVVAPAVAAAGSASVGSSAPPDVIVDSFTLAGGAAASNLGTNGSLTIETSGKMRVIGNVQLTGLSDANALNLIAGNALEIILGQGSVRLVNGANPAGQLNMVSDDIIVATQAAIADVGAASSTAAIDARLAQNDGITLDEGALFARGIRAEVVGGFYVQNSGVGGALAQRRGLTFGDGGLDVAASGRPRIVVNAIRLGTSGQVTGLDTLASLTIGGASPSNASGSFDRLSTLNGCLIVHSGGCVPASGLNLDVPVQDLIEEEITGDEGGAGEGNNLPQPLITTRDLDPLSGEPLVDDPVTGAGNDDLWTPPAQ